MRVRTILVATLVSCCFSGVLSKKAKNYDPPCRKSPIFQALSTSAASSSPNETQQLVVFGGKGWAWVKRPKAARKGKCRKGKCPTVELLGDMWTFDTNEGIWAEPQLLETGSAVEEPSQRWKSISTTINGGREMVVFGGCNESGTRGVMNDLWVFTLSGLNQGRWRQIATQNPPPPRRAHIVEANSTHLIVYGGKTEAKEYIPGVSPVDAPHDRILKDVWSLPLSALQEGAEGEAQWSNGADFPGMGRWGSTGIMLTAPNAHDVLAVFGGRHLFQGFGTHTVDLRAYKYENELWLYDTTADTWELKAPQGPLPPPRDHHVAARMGNDLYVFGGRLKESRAPDAVVADLWSYSIEANRWTQLVWGTQSPSSRYMPGAAQFRQNGILKFAVFGGETIPANVVASTKRTSLNDIWLYDPRPGGGWEQISADDCSKQRSLVPPNSVASWPGSVPILLSEHRNIVSMPAWALVSAVAFLASSIAYLVRRRTLPSKDTNTDYQVLLA